MTTKQPWTEKLYESTGQRTQKNQKSNLTGLIFTIMLTIFIVVVVLMIGLSIYLSTGGSQNETASTSFYDPKAASSSEASQPASESSSTEETAASSEETEETITVQAGEGASAIAARAGITLEELYALNPEYMTTGSWYANPGDVVRIR